MIGYIQIEDKYVKYLKRLKTLERYYIKTDYIKERELPTLSVGYLKSKDSINYDYNKRITPYHTVITSPTENFNDFINGLKDFEDKCLSYLYCMYNIEYLDKIGGYDFCFINSKGNYNYHYYTRDNKCYGLLPIISNHTPNNNRIPYTFVNRISKIVDIDEIAYLLPLLYKIYLENNK